MKKVTIAIILILLAVVVLFTLKSTNLFVTPSKQKAAKTFSFKNYVVPNTIKMTGSGDYIVSGVVRKQEREGVFVDTGSFILKLNPSLDIEWVKSVNALDSWAIPLTDGNIAVYTGDTLTKLDKNGNVLFSKKYTFNAQNYSFQNDSFARKNVIIETKDKGFAIIGKGIMKLDSSGNVEWVKEYSGQGTYHSLSIIGSAITELDNGNFLGAFWIQDPPLTGESGAVWGCCNGFLIVEVDSKGNTIFTRWIRRNNSNEVPNSIIVNDDGSFTVPGFSITKNLNNSSFTTELPVAFFNKNGNLTLFKSFIIGDGDDYFISYAHDGYIGAGQGLIKFDKNFNPEWAKENNMDSLCYVDTDGYNFTAVGDAPEYLSNGKIKHRILIVRGNTAQFDETGFVNFYPSAKQITPDVNKPLDLQVKDITSKISVTPIEIEFKEIE